MALARRDELASLVEPVRRRLDAANAARETGLAAARRTIQSCSQSIRATHRLEWDQAEQLADTARDSLRQAQEALKPFPQLAASGPLHDAAKEYAEARLTEALVTGKPCTALCGKTWVPSRDPKRYPVCPTCKEIAAGMGWQVPSS